MLIQPTMNRNEVAGGDIGAQMINKGGLLGIPLAVLGMLGALAGLADSIGWALVFVAVALFALLVVTVFVAWMVRKLAQRLEFTGGVLTYRNWRGRSVTLGAPQDILVTRGQVAYKSALALDVPILVVAGAPDAEPVFLRARHWRRTELSALFRRLKVRPVGEFDRVYTTDEMLRQFPGIRLPWSLSRPALVWGITTLVVLSWTAGTIALIALLAE